MYPNSGASPIPVDMGVFSACEAVIDIISNPLKTELMLRAEDRGIPAYGGLHMLIAQAVCSSEVFNVIATMNNTEDALPDPDDPGDLLKHDINSAIYTISRDLMNIALIGMPGCGKTAVGRALAWTTRHKFIDTDELVVKIAGKSIDRIIKEDGEDAFRDLEELVIAEVSQTTGCIIATGGGVVLRESNRRLLRHNCAIVFLDRKVEDLPTEGRPLSEAHGIKKLHEQRMPLYESWCNFKITVRDDIVNTAQTIRDLLGYKDW